MSVMLFLVYFPDQSRTYLILHELRHRHTTIDINIYLQIGIMPFILAYMHCIKIIIELLFLIKNVTEINCIIYTNLTPDLHIRRVG